MKTVPFHSLALETSDQARRLIRSQGIVAVEQYGNQIIGFAFSMEFAQKIIGNCVESAQNTVPITSFNNNFSRYSSDAISSKKTITVSGKNEFVFCNTVFFKNHWGVLQAVLSPQKARHIGRILNLPIWPSVELASQNFIVIGADFQQPMPHILAKNLMGQADFSSIQREIDLLGRPALISHRGKNVKGYLAPLSMMGDLLSFGLKLRELSLTDMRTSRADHGLSGDRLYRVSANIPNKQSRGQAKFLILPADVKPEVVEFMRSCYDPSQYKFPYDPYNDHPPQNYSVPSLSSPELAQILAKMIGEVTDSLSMTMALVKTRNGMPRFMCFMADSHVLTRLSYINFGHHDVYRPRFSDPTKTIGWLSDHRPSLQIDPDFLTQNQEAISGHLQSVFAPFSKKYDRNILISHPDCHKKPPLALTQDRALVGAAMKLDHLRRYGICGG